MSKRLLYAGLCLFGLLLGIAFLAPVLAPYDPYEVTGSPFAAPCAEHILGSNDIGQDLFSELLYGARTSLAVGILSALISVGLGTAAGMAGGWFGGRIDRILTRITAFFLTLPYLPTLLILSAFTRPGIVGMSVILGVISFGGTARVVRSQTMALRKKEYITSIMAMGASDSYVLVHHVGREILPWLFYQMAARIRSGILSESSLSFLGLGNSSWKSWGTMLYYAQAKNALLTNAWLWWVLPPGLCIVLVSCALALISYGMEGKTDERNA